MVNYWVGKTLAALGTAAGKRALKGYGKSWKFGGKGRMQYVSGIPRRMRGKMRVGGFYGRYKSAGAELKFHDITIDDALISASGEIVEDSCNEITQGTTESQRIGRKCTIKFIDWRYNITLNSGSVADVSDIVRVILYLDRQANGGGANVDLILGAAATYQSFNNLANKSRFRILCDKFYTMNPTAAAGGDATTLSMNRMKSVRFTRRCSIPIEYDNNTGALTEIRSNNIGVLLISKEGLCSFDSHMRLRFRG